MRTSVVFTRLIATIFVVLCAQSVLAEGQKVFKCGDSYSQLPCDGGSVILAEDPRDSAQKQQSDTATERAARLARALEAQRIAGEQAAITHAPVPKTRQDIAPKVKPVEYFVAQVPGPKPKTKRKKTVKKPVRRLG